MCVCPVSAHVKMVRLPARIMTVHVTVSSIHGQTGLSAIRYVVEDTVREHVL